MSEFLPLKAILLSLGMRVFLISVSNADSLLLTMENTSVEASDVKLGEEVAPLEETHLATTETTVETTTTSTDVETGEEDSPYKVELEKMKADLAKKDDLIRKKDGALKEARAKLKEPKQELEDDEPKVGRPKALSAEEVRQLYREERNAERFEEMLNQATSDAQERELIKLHFDNSIKRTGNVTADFKMAVALANQPLIDQARNARFERETAERGTIQSMGGGSFQRSGQPGYMSDPALRTVANILDKLDGDGKTKKYLGK